MERFRTLSIAATLVATLFSSSLFAQNTVVLVDFGASPAQNQYGSAWNIVLRNPAATEYVSGTNPAYEGITESVNGEEEICWIGIRGTSPINFTYGQRIKVTWFNRDEFPQYLRASVSLTDSTAIAGAEISSPWYAAYDYDQGGYSPNIQPGERKTLFFNITNAGSVLSNGSPACEGNRFCINVCRRFYGGEQGRLVLEKIELVDDADHTPPSPPVNLTAEMVSLAAGEPAHAVRLSWLKPTDPAGAGGQHVSGISRYFIYRNGQVFDALDFNWAEFLDDSLEYVDDSVLPGQTYTYSVTTLDRAIKGRCPSWHNVATMRHGNESAAATVSVTVPSFGLTGVFDPFSGMQYLGKIKLDGVGYAGRSLTCNPNGNPNYNPATELPGSLFLTGHAQVVDVAEINIPIPADTNDYDAMPSVAYLQPFALPWPSIYFYENAFHPFPQGSVDQWAGLGWHPGKDGVPPGIYYSTFMSYAGDPEAHSQGWINLGLDATHSPWGLDDPDEPGNQLLPFYHVGKLIAAAPQNWADTHLGGRSLLTGLGWPISGHGWPSCGPSLYASAPWTGGTLPDSAENIAALKLLRYGSTFQTATWQRNWTATNNYQNAAWISSDSTTHAFAIAGALTQGDNWYGGEQGDQSIYIDLDAPTPETGSNGRGQAATLLRNMIQFYDPADFAAVAAGTVQAHEPQPYATLNVSPFFMRPDTAYSETMRSVAVDNVHGYFYAYEQEYNYQYLPVIHVWKMGCLPNLTLSGRTLKTGGYRSAGNLTASNCSVGNGTSVSLISSASVTLTQNFTVPAGAVFEVKIEPCTGN